MPNPISFGALEITLVADMEHPVAAPDPEDPFCILIMGDFSGRANHGVAPPGGPWANQKPIRVDRDNFDAVMASFGIGLCLPLLGKTAPPVTIRFSELEDFHPDRLHERLEVFNALKDTRKRLDNPATFAAVANSLKTATPPADTSPAPKKSETRAVQNTGTLSGNLLDQVISQTPGGPPDIPSNAPPPEWQSFLQDIVRPHLAPDPHPRQVEMIAAVDTAAGELMRRVLHDPDFMALEAAWKGLHFLVSRLETDALLKLYVLDVSKAELSADLSRVENLNSTGFYRLLVEQTIETPGAEPWAVIIGNYFFEQCLDDIEFLGRIAQIAKASGAPFIAGARDNMVCFDSLAKTPDPDDWEPSVSPETAIAWQALRKIPEAAYIGLALPRFLLRLPFSAGTDPIEAFAFEEVSPPLDQETFLWGNAAFACALLLGHSFSYRGWQLRAGDQLDIHNLPLYLYKEGGESILLPCAEALLTQRAAERILESGLMPLLSFFNQDTIRLARFQAIAAPLCRLAGRWEQ